MTQNIEQRTLAATVTLESSAKTVDEIANTDKDVSTPAGLRKSFPKISREWDNESQRLQTQWKNDSAILRQDWQSERNEFSTKALGVKPWESGASETNINQQRRWDDGHTYLPKTVPAAMDIGGPDGNWIPYTADKSETLNDVFGRKPIDLVAGVVLVPDSHLKYPKLNAVGKVWELTDNDQQITIKSFHETSDGYLVITLDDESQLIANKMEGASRVWVDKEAAKTFDNVDALKLSNYRYEGKTVRLLGRYYTGDGGKAYFEMKKGATPDGVEFIDLSDGWYLQLVESDWISVVTLGMSDLHSDNKTAFESIRSSRFKNLTMPAKTFRMSTFRPKGVNIVCAKGAKVELFNENNPVMAALFPNTVIEDLWIHSTETNLPWQRVECESTHDVRFVRGKISGFKDSAEKPNSWGVLINRSKRVYFEGTEFSDNSQADIAVVDGNEDIGIKDCFNSQDDGLIVNFEPNGSLGNKRCTVDGVSMRKFYLLVNSRTANPLDKITVKNSHAKELVYDGADCTFENVSFDVLRPENVHHNFSGEIDARGTFGIGDNLLVDPHLMVVGATNGNWTISFSDALPNERYALFEHENYIGIQLNPLRKHCVVQLRSQNPIAVDASKMYYLHITGTAISNDDDGHIADHIRLNFYDGSGQKFDTHTIRPFRHSAGQKMPVRSEGTFFSIPDGAVSCRVEVANAFAQTKVSTIITAITFHEMRRDSVKFNDILDVYHRLSNGPRRCEKSLITSVGLNYQLPMRLNDIVSVDSQKQMFRCVDPDTVKDGHWVGTFKEV
ncbi:hypothetical protein ACO11R_004063 [Vibrio parahaemolyticus]